MASPVVLARPRSHSMTDVLRARQRPFPVLFDVSAAEILTLPNPVTQERRLEAFVNALPRLTQADLEVLGKADASCPICLTPLLVLLAEEETALALNSSLHHAQEFGVTRFVQTCGHVFCRRDVRKWMCEARTTCPTCRCPFISPTLVASPPVLHTSVLPTASALSGSNAPALPAPAASSSNPDVSNLPNPDASAPNTDITTNANPDITSAIADTSAPPNPEPTTDPHASASADPKPESNCNTSTNASSNSSTNTSTNTRINTNTCTSTYTSTNTSTNTNTTTSTDTSTGTNPIPDPRTNHRPPPPIATRAFDTHDLDQLSMPADMQRFVRAMWEVFARAGTPGQSHAGNE